MMKNKRGIIIISILAALILAINIITASYSWFSPKVETGIGMSFVQDDRIRSEKCSFKLYQGNMRTQAEATTENPDYGEIDYSPSDEITDTDVTVSNVNNAEHPDGLFYFRIEVLNADTANASNISLYFNKAVPANTTVGIVKPNSACHKYTDSTNNVNLVRNAYVKKYVATDVDPGKLYVEFFVKCEGDSFKFKKSNITLLYN